jgi:hypothetical protein
MESPITTVKSALNPSSVIKFIAGALVAFAIADLLNLTDWILYPVSSAKSKWSKPGA